MATSRAQLWLDNKMSDMEIVVASTDVPEQTVMTIPVHAIILMEASEVFTRHIQTDRQRELEQAQQQDRESGSEQASQVDVAAPLQLAGRKRTQSPPQSSRPAKRPPFQYVPHGLKTYRVVLDPQEPFTVPEAVLHHVYTGTLPEDTEELVWMVRRSDYLGMTATLEACLNKLQAQAEAKALTLAHVTLLHQLNEAMAPAGIQQLQQAVPGITADVLASTFPNNAVQLLEDTALLQQFTQLPLALVQQWVGLPAVVFDSGNTLAVLLTAWHDAQPSPPTEDLCQQLSALLPLASLTLCFHLQTVQHLKWWRPPKHSKLPSGTTLAHVLSILSPKGTDIPVSWQAAHSAAKLQCSHTATHTWTVSYSQLQLLWHDKSVALDSHIAIGYEWRPCLQLIKAGSESSGQHDIWLLKLGIKLLWPDVLAEHGLSTGCPAVAAYLKVKCTLRMCPKPPATPPMIATFANENTWRGLRGWQVRCIVKELRDLAPEPTSTWTLDLTCSAVTA